MVHLVLGAKGVRPREGKYRQSFVDVAKVEVLALDSKLAENGDNFIAADNPSRKSIRWNKVAERGYKHLPDAV